MSIQSVNDLVPNQEYYISLLPKSKTYRVVYLGCVKTVSAPDFYFRFLERKGFKEGISSFGMDEIGIGSSREEAKMSYALLKVELPEKHFEDTRQVPGLEDRPVYK